MSWHPDWLVPKWPAPAAVRAVCTTRAGGVSQGPFASLNLGDHVGDLPEHVAANRAILKTALQTQAVFMRQVHGTEVLNLGLDADPYPQADAAIAQEPGRACLVMVADCLPILLAHESLPLVAAVHAGWRGLAGACGGAGGSSQGVVEQTLTCMSAWAKCPLERLTPGLMAWLGPCIGPRAFEVGPEVYRAYTHVDPQAQACFVPAGAGKFWADLPALARLRLGRAGVLRCYGNEGSDDWCTVRNSGLFSHRASIVRRGVTGGRMAAGIWLV